MDDTKRELLAYYEAEAHLKVRDSVKGFRVSLAEDFVALLRAEGRRSVIDFGAGPGRDGDRFAASGIRYLGVDLAFGNARLASERGVTVLQGDMTCPPIRRHAFDAGWSMSALMHLPESELQDAIRNIAEVLSPGAPLFVGLWGGDRIDIVSDRGIEGQRRLFSLRSHDANAELLSTAGRIEWSATHDVQSTEWEYHVFRLRVGDS